MIHGRVGVSRRPIVVALVCSALLMGVGPRPAVANHTSEVTAASGLAFSYYTDVSLFGGPSMLRGYGQQVCAGTNVPSGCVPANEEAASASPSVTCPGGGGELSVTDPDGAKASYGPAVIFGGIWPEEAASAPPSGPLTSSLDCQLGAEGYVTASTELTLMPPGSAHPGGAGPGPFIADEVHSSCTANADGTNTTSVTIVNGILETSYDPDTQLPATTEPIPENPPVNYTRQGTIDHVGDSYEIVFNEQVVNPDGSITVNAAHMYLLGPTAVGDMVVGSSTCGPLTTVPISDGPSVSIGDVAVHEGDTKTRSAMFTVTLSSPAASTVAVSYATADGTAAAPGDYTAKAGTVTFAPGVTTAMVKVPVLGDVADEGDEAFTVALSSPTGGAVIADGTGTGTIVDDDPPAVNGNRLTVGDAAVHEGDGGMRMAGFTVSLSKGSTSYVTVSFATKKGSAIGTDFTAKSGTLRFAPGTTSLAVKVAITPDDLPEGDETFTVQLSAASGATIADATGLGTIIDDD